MFFFQVPRLPEAVLSASNFASLRYALRNEPVRPGTFSPEDIERYVEALARPGALDAALNYYRALFRRNPFESRGMLRRIEAPVLVIWGEKDSLLGAELAEPDRYWVPDLQMERLPDAGHFVAEDRPEKVNALLLDFMNRT